MSSDYKSISIEEMHRYLEILSKNDTRASDYSFANIWGWAPHYELEWRFDGPLCWIRQNRPTPCYWAPVGPWDAVENWKEKPEMAPGSVFIRVPERLCEIWSIALEDKASIEEARGQWDYIYLSSDLSELSGKRYHTKKNQLNQFLRQYPYEYHSLTEKCVEEVLNMQTEWCRWHDCEESESLLAENDAVARVLTHFKQIPGLSGGIIRVEDTPVAYTIAEPLNSETLIMHFEKGATGFKGVYQAINFLFCNDVGVKYTYINREQDLDIEGLRQAKLSYQPWGFAKKCRVVVH